MRDSTAADAAARLAEHGPNRLKAAAARGKLERFLAQFDNLLIYVLLGAAALALVVGHVVDALVILAVVLVNTAIGFLQEGKAEDALRAISSLVDPEAKVRRDGRNITIKADDVVPGDLVLVTAGDRVSADLRLLRTKGLKLDEAALTGESVPVEKQPEPVPPGSDLAERRSMAFSGTIVAAGQGSGIVVATAGHTELGRISSMLGNVAELETPLIRQMGQFARQITVGVMAAAVVVFGVGYALRGLPLVDAFMAVVGLFVAAIPEGLPAVMTITLAIGVQRMAARKAIIRQLPAVETLGAVSVICTDKTGTLTRNEMAVRAVVTADGAMAVDGVGYAPEGAFAADGAPAAPGGRPLLMAIIEAGLLCSDAEIGEVDGRWSAEGDPMEAALVTLAMKAGLDPAARRQDCGRLDEIPFDSERKLMATLNQRGGDGERTITVKGAPEQLIEMAGAVMGEGGPEPIDRQRWHDQVSALAADGQRVLGFATKRAAPSQASLEPGDLKDGLVLLGLMGFIDPPREAAVAAVEACKAAGIRVVMITGDHALTAKAIAEELGLGEAVEVCTGSDLEAMDAETFAEAAQSTRVFARTTPEHKLRLVEALQAQSLIVAMTGDGVNDSPALKRADVGVAMGRKGTEAAKQASDMVLADDNFASIVAAIREGRTVYDNIVKVIAWTLPTSCGEALIIVAAVLLGLELPITPVQILWVNMVTVVTLGLVLAFEPTEPGTMHRPPRPASEPLLTGVLLWQIVLVSLLFVAGAFGMFTYAVSRGLALEEARTITVNTIVVMEIFYLFNVRHMHGTSLTLADLRGTPAVLAGVGGVVLLQLVFTYAPFMAIPFGSAAVGFSDGILIVAVGILLFAIVETDKAARRSWRDDRSPGKATATR